MAIMKKPVRKISRVTSKKLKALDAEHLPVETGLKFWFFHALHWCALLACVVAFLFIGYTG
jgi:hypothetical protein